MVRETERGGFLKQDTSEPADIAVYNGNMDRIHADVMSVPFTTADPSALTTWPGKLILRDSGDPTYFLPDLRVNKADNFWERAISGSWEAYTPATTNITVGNGTLLGRFMHIGSILHCEILLIWGSTTAFTGGIGFGTPPGYKLRVPPEASSIMRAGLGTWMGRVSGTNSLQKGRINRRETGVGIDMEPRTNDVPAAVITATTPATWQNGNKLYLQVRGEVDWE